MGKSSSRQRNRSNITFPTSRYEALEEYETSGVPTLKWRRATKGKSEPLGTRLRKYGLTPEEQLMQYAPGGSKPERMVFGWLLRHKFIFEFQVSVLGGRAPGGAVIDFVIYDKVPAIALRVQSFWHAPPEVKWADDIQAQNLTEMGYQVEDVWESDVNTIDRVDATMQHIMFGAPKMGTVAEISEEKCPYCEDTSCGRYNFEV